MLYYTACKPRHPNRQIRLDSETTSKRIPMVHHEKTYLEIHRNVLVRNLLIRHFSAGGNSNETFSWFFRGLEGCHTFEVWLLDNTFCYWLHSLLLHISDWLRQEWHFFINQRTPLQHIPRDKWFALTIDSIQLENTVDSVIECSTGLTYNDVSEIKLFYTILRQVIKKLYRDINNLRPDILSRVSNGVYTSNEPLTHGARIL